MRVLLTGATGFVGRALGQRLAADGCRLVVLTRSPERAKPLLGFDCELHQWEPLLGPAPEAAFDSGVDAVIHLAGEPVADRRWSAEVKSRIHQSRVVGTRHLIETINKVFDDGDGRPGSFLMASAIGYYGDRGDEVLTEDSQPGTGFLAEVCERWESEGARLNGPRLAIFRLGMVLGKGGGALEKITPMFRRGLGARLGSGKQWNSWVHVDDVCGIFSHVLKIPTMDGILNVVSPLPVTNADFTRALAHAVGKPKPFLSAPKPALRLMLGEMSSMLLASQRVLPVKARASGYHFRHERLDEALANCLGT